MLLRRTKEERASDIELPPKLVIVRKDPLDEREEDFYQALYTESKAQFNTYVDAGTILVSSFHPLIGSFYQLFYIYRTIMPMYLIY